MSVHDGHRERLKNRFIEHGLDNFDEINALELLLFFAVPRKDTNETAHMLLDRFGSLQGVFDAHYNELREVKGVGDNAALLITLIPRLMRKALIGKKEKGAFVTNSSSAGEYLVPRFMCEQDEVLYLLCLDSAKRVICCQEMNRGVVNEVEANIRKIVEAALKNRASSAILAHNHPDGIALPSREDDYVTKMVRQSLKLVNIPLVDHIIVSGDDYVSYADSNMLMF